MLVATSLFSVGCWGGATLMWPIGLSECPWQRLRTFANICQFDDSDVLRASNAGYVLTTNNVVKALSQGANGIDVFRVFDSLNWVENMRVATLSSHLAKSVKQAFVTLVIS